VVARGKEIVVRPTSEHATFLVGYADVAPNVISRDNVERSIFHVYEVLRIIKLGEPSFIFFKSLSPITQLILHMLNILCQIVKIVCSNVKHVPQNNEV